MRSILDIKKGDLTTTQIVMIIILVTSFAILLFFIVRLNLRQESVKDVCHNSVVLRGNSAIPGATTTIPLNCRQAYVCVTADGTCERMSSYDYKLDVNTEEEMYHALAEEMATCWWTYGEGKINYVGGDWKSKTYCSICSQLRFDNSIKSELFPSGKIDKGKFYDYLQNNKMPGTEVTYSQYLFGTNQITSLLDSPQINNFGVIDLDRKTEGTNELSDYIVIMGIASEVSTGLWIAGGALAVAVIAGTAVATGGASLIVGAIVVTAAASGGAIAGAFAATTVRGLSGNTYLAPTIVPYPSEEYKGLQCADIKTLS